MDDLMVDDRVRIPATDLSWSAARSGGPGGQNVNRVATKVDLRFDLESTTVLGEEVKARLRRLHANRLDAQGRLIVTSESGRTQARNLGICRAKLAEMIAAAMVRPKKRRATKPSRAARAKRLEHKRKRGEKKSLRGRVRGE